ncbi:MAG TPA: DUF305 domain-containing protein [Ferruginibacter sp.]|jgi:uncharacterized protein (DUF305 family)|nr:DUF305 domain-containing protein [Ferruginibacter sp.]
MKSVFFFLCLPFAIFSCNNSNQKNVVDHSGHVAHDTAAIMDTTQVSGIKGTMNAMMQSMHNLRPTGNNDIDFTAMMIEHHKGAVDMSKIEIEKGINAEMKAFAKKVIEQQDKEIIFMQEFISKAAKNISANASDFQKALNGSMMAMMNNNTPAYQDTDMDFAAQMIPHHQSAVDMAKAYLEFGKEPGLRIVCQNIIASQSKEISWLKGWLAKKNL